MCKNFVDAFIKGTLLLVDVTATTATNIDYMHCETAHLGEQRLVLDRV